MALRRGRCKPVLPLQHRRELADRRAPAFVKTHFFMLRALFGRLVEHARRIERAAVLRLEGQDRGQREPGIGGLPAFGEDGGEDEAIVRDRFEEAAVDVRLKSGERRGVVSGTSVSVSVGPGGRGIKKKKQKRVMTL